MINQTQQSSRKTTYFTVAGIFVFPVLMTTTFTSLALSNTAYFGDANSTKDFGGSEKI
jgi:hypothetical protein